MKLFISYRRSDSAHFAGRLVERLRNTRGITGIFFDIDSIGAGEDFERRIRAALEQSTAVLVLIGQNWLEGRRLFEDDDFVRLEVRAALSRHNRVIPVLLDDTRMPAAEQLPADLDLLPRLNAVQVRHGAFERDVLHLIDTVMERKAPGGYAQFVRGHPTLASLVEAFSGAVLGLLLLIVTLMIIQSTHKNDDWYLNDEIKGVGVVLVVLAVVLLGAATPWFLRRRGILR